MTVLKPYGMWYMSTSIPRVHVHPATPSPCTGLEANIKVVDENEDQNHRVAGKRVGQVSCDVDCASIPVVHIDDLPIVQVQPHTLSAAVILRSRHSRLPKTRSCLLELPGRTVDHRRGRQVRCPPRCRRSAGEVEEAGGGLQGGEILLPRCLLQASYSREAVSGI